jgi:hypothetical protein
MLKPGTVARTWSVSKELAREINGLAAETQVPDSHLVEKMLWYALSSIRTGHLQLETRVVARELLDDWQSENGECRTSIIKGGKIDDQNE